MEEVLIWFVENTVFISFLCGVIFSVTALITLKFPPKKINYLYGYRTTASMKNQQVWDFAQHYSGIKMCQGGLALIVVSFVNLFLELSEAFQVTFGLSLVILSCIYLFFSTERAIRKNFPNV
jgi:uncharacterized membrane protein